MHTTSNVALTQNAGTEHLIYVHVKRMSKYLYITHLHIYNYWYMHAYRNPLVPAPHVCTMFTSHYANVRLGITLEHAKMNCFRPLVCMFVHAFLSVIYNQLMMYISNVQVCVHSTVVKLGTSMRIVAGLNITQS